MKLLSNSSLPDRSDENTLLEEGEDRNDDDIKSETDELEMARSL